MKKFIKAIVVSVLIGSMTTPIYSTPIAQDKIFPSYTGIKAQLIGTNVNVRAYPSSNSCILTSVSTQSIQVLGQNEEWYRVKLRGQEGWIYKSFIQVVEGEFIPYSKILGEEVVEYGKQFIGTPYVWGGNDLKKGVDCSGLTKGIYETFDIDLSRVSYMQAHDGKQITKSELMPGDLVFFDTSGNNNGQISHVGIYAGNGQFLHADSTHGVMLSNLNSNYYRKSYVTSIRVIPA